MKFIGQLMFSLFFLLILYSCNSLQQIAVIDIEVVEPCDVKLNKEYKKLAIRYNNCNVSTPVKTNSLDSNKDAPKQLSNIDSIIPLAYYNYFLSKLSQQEFFDTIIQVEPTIWSSIKVLDTIKDPSYFRIDSVKRNSNQNRKLKAFRFSRAILADSIGQNDYTPGISLHRDFGLYQHSDLQTIYNSTNADLLLSLDYFSEIDEISYTPFYSLAIVNVNVFWNLYDLKRSANIGIYNKNHDKRWSSPVYNKRKTDFISQEEAALITAEFASWCFVKHLVPHWVSVKRMYYKSNHNQLKIIKELIHQNKWNEAAQIWKLQTTNKNKMIAAKCKYNMALACEMQGNFDAAIEWVSESFHELGQLNEEHASNCRDYIRILALRKQDIKRIDNQVGKIE